MGTLIEVEAVEPLALKGKSEPVPAFLLLEIKERSGSATLGWPMVGRVRESALLDAELEAAVAERTCRRAVISGPPGIGKTRLAEEAFDRWKGKAEVLSARCAPEGEGDSQAAIGLLVSAVLELAGSADEPDVRAAVEMFMSEHERGPLVASALARSLAGSDGGSPDEAAWAFAELIGARAGTRPVVVLVDDAQWAEPEMLAVLDEIARRADAPVLQLYTTLPERDPTAESEVAAPTTRISLPPLDDDSAGRLLSAVLDGPVDAAAQRQVLDAAEGNPFFLIGTARMLIDEHHLKQREGVWVPRGGDVDLPVPGSIVGLIAARLDRLPQEELRLLEAGSVIGQVFELDAAASLLGRDGMDASSSATALMDRRLLIPVGDPDAGTLAFSHALVREVAYGSLTKERRAGLHERFADRCSRTGEGTEAVVGTHLERAFTLRLELGAADDAEFVLARRAMEALAGAGGAALRIGNRQAAVGFLARIARLADAAPLDDDAREARSQAGHLAYELGDWAASRVMLEPLAASGDVGAAKELGQSLAQLARRTADESELIRARELLGMAMEQGSEPDAASSLAGTWKGIDDAVALRLYRRALELDPSDPYALGNVLEYEVIDAVDLGPIETMRSAIEGAARRCRDQIGRAENLPWAAYDLAKFTLVLGDADASFLASCLAIDRSSASFMVETSLRSLDRMMPLSERLYGLVPNASLLRLALAGLFGDTQALDSARNAVTPETDPLPSRVIVLAGGSAGETHKHIQGFGDLLRGALQDVSGTLISGGTAQGVSALAGDLAEASGGSLLAVGYLPDIVPAGIPTESPGKRYAEIRRTSGKDFSVLEPLRYWADLISQGSPPSGVRLIAIGGGRISSAEYRVALALGAGVGAIRGSGGAAAELLQDPWWATSGGLSELAPEVGAIRDFLEG